MSNLSLQNHTRQTVSSNLTFQGNKNRKKTNLTGKIAGGIAGYSFVAPVVNRQVMIKLMPKLNNCFNELSQACKKLPAFYQKSNISIDNVLKAGDAIKNLPIKSKGLLFGVLTLTTLMSILAGSRIGSLIQSKFFNKKDNE